MLNPNQYKITFDTCKETAVLLYFHRWSYGIVLWEVFTIGKYVFLKLYSYRYRTICHILEILKPFGHLVRERSRSFLKLF